MAKSGARLSIFPMSIPHWHTMTVMIRALVGSPDAEDLANGCKNGIMSSFAIACVISGYETMRNSRKSILDTRDKLL